MICDEPHPVGRLHILKPNPILAKILEGSTPDA